MDVDYLPWKNPLDALDPIDSVLVRNVADEMDSREAGTLLSLDPKVIRARATELLKSHYDMDELAGLLELAPHKRLRLAEEIVNGTLHGFKKIPKAQVIGLVPKKLPPTDDDPGPKAA